MLPVIVDACHSGTVNRELDRRDSNETLELQTRAYGDTVFTVKALPYRGSKSERQVLPQTLSSEKTPIATANEGMVILSAVRDTQKALATPRGSAFTLALYETMQGPLGRGGVDGTRSTITPNLLIREASRLIARKVGHQERYTPTLGGDSARFDQPLVPERKGLATAHSSHRHYLETTLNRFDALSLQLERDDYRPGETVSLRIVIPHAGYLNILAVDQDDTVTVIFPNAYHTQNRFPEGELELPGDRSFEWTTSAPDGETLLAAVYSREPLNWYNSSLDVQFDGSVARGFPSVQPSDLLLNTKSTAIRSALQVFTVCSGDTPCR